LPADRRSGGLCGLFYAGLNAAHTGLTDDKNTALNAGLLRLANHIGDADVLAAALKNSGCTRRAKRWNPVSGQGVPRPNAANRSGPLAQPAYPATCRPIPAQRSL